MIDWAMLELPLVYHPHYVSPLPQGHRFPMPKFGMIYALLLDDGVAQINQFVHPEKPDLSELALAHTLDYIYSFIEGRLDSKALRKIGLPWSEDLTERTISAVGGTICTAELALQYKLACNTAGGTHHAFPEHGSGFCIFNDLAIAARVMQRRNLAQRVLVIDLDVHQGDGTAFIFRNDPSVFTFSMHCEKNFPSQKQISDYDVSLEAGLRDEEYMEALEIELPKVFERFQPDLVLYDAGVDPHQADRLGLLKLSYEGLKARDHYVIQKCMKRRYPIACVVGGGYSHDLDELSYRHTILHRVASELYREYLVGNASSGKNVPLRGEWDSSNSMRGIGEV